MKAFQPFPPKEVRQAFDVRDISGTGRLA